MHLEFAGLVLRDPRFDLPDHGYRPPEASLAARPSAGLVEDDLNPVSRSHASAEVDHGDCRFVVQRDRIGVNPVANLLYARIDSRGGVLTASQDGQFILIRPTRRSGFQSRGQESLRITDMGKYRWRGSSRRETNPNLR